MIDFWSTLAVSNAPISKSCFPERHTRSRFTLEIQSTAKSDYHHMDLQDQWNRFCNIKEDREMTRHESRFLELVEELPPPPLFSSDHPRWCANPVAGVHRPSIKWQVVHEDDDVACNLAQP